MDVITPEQMNMIDSNCVKLGIPRLLLMENAGRSIVDLVKNKFNNIEGKKVVIIAGTGNNGGDAFVAARHLTTYKAIISVILLGNTPKTSEAALNWRGLQNMSNSVRLYTIVDDSFKDQLKKEIIESSIIIDAIFGTGIRGQIKEPYSEAIDLINNSNSYIVSVDIPSGLDPLTGDIRDKSVVANSTVTFHKPKSGLYKNKEYVGELIIAPIGIPPEAEEGV
jgi:NAD(P)H-hydrate epimerase